MSTSVAQIADAKPNGWCVLVDGEGGLNTVRVVNPEGEMLKLRRDGYSIPALKLSVVAEIGVKVKGFAPLLSDDDAKREIWSVLGS